MWQQRFARRGKGGIFFPLIRKAGKIIQLEIYLIKSVAERVLFFEEKGVDV